MSFKMVGGSRGGGGRYWKTCSNVDLDLGGNRKICHNVDLDL